MIIQRTLLWFTLNKYLGTFLSLTAVLFVFMNFCITDSFNILMMSIFQYLTDSSALKNFLPFWEHWLPNRKQTNWFYLLFQDLTPSKLCMSLKFVTNKLHINCFCLNPSDEITSMKGIALWRKFNIQSIWYTVP